MKFDRVPTRRENKNKTLQSRRKLTITRLPVHQLIERANICPYSFCSWARC